MKYSLKTKLSLAIAFGALLTVALISVLSNYFVKSQFEDYLRLQQETKTQEIVANLSRQYNPEIGAWNEPYVHAIGMNVLLDGYIIKLTDKNQQPIWDAETCDMQQCMQVMDNITRITTTMYPKMDGEFHSKTLPIRVADKTVGEVNIRFFGPYFLREMDFQFLKSLNIVLAAVGLVALAFSVVVGFLMARRLSQPIHNTVSVAKQISDGNYSVRLDDTTSTKEVHELIHSINHLAESVEQQENLRKQLTADVAHELRTPLTTVGTHIEAMIEGVWEPSVERLQSCHEEIDRIGKLVRDLECLAKVEGEVIKLDKTQVDLHALSEQVASQLKLDLEAKALHVSISGANAIVLADSDRMRQVLVNLITNAIKYTPQGGQIDIALEQTKQVARLSIRDNGIGISKEELPFIFERFYRADASRNRMTGGSGIGLAIVKSIVTAHGGQATATSEPGVGTEFVVELPRNAQVPR